MPTLRHFRIRISGLVLLLLVCLPAAGQETDADVPNPSAAQVGMRMKDVPLALQEAWIRFHELELCQSIEAEFVFHQDGMEVRIRADNESDRQKLEKLLDPLREDYQIRICEVEPPGAAGRISGDFPEEVPPSLWNNEKLRLYMQKNFAPAAAILSGKGNEPRSAADADRMVKQSLLMFSQQTLDWGRKMSRYASDLPPLADAAFNENMAPELKSRAEAICAAHAHDIERLAHKLANNLVLALPNSPNSLRLPQTGELPAFNRNLLLEEASQIFTRARDLAQRVHYFVYPQDFTVSLSDLRDPGLPEALNDLRAQVITFLRHMNRSGRH